MARVTKREMFENLYALVADSDSPDKNDLGEFILHEIELLNKKHNSKSGPTKTQLENIEYKRDIIAVLSDAAPEPMKATAIGNKVDITVQKASALLRQLVNDNEVVRNTNGKETTFTLS